MEGDLNRILVTTGRMRVDTEELHRAALQLQGIVKQLEHLVSVSSRAKELTSYATHSLASPQITMEAATRAQFASSVAAQECECVYFEVLRVLHMAEGLAERLSFVSRLLESAEREAVRLFAREDSFVLPGMSGGVWGMRFFKNQALLIDCGLSVWEFVTGKGEGMTGPRFEWDALLMGRKIAGAGRLGSAGEGTREAARVASALAFIAGTLAHGRSRGVEVSGAILEGSAHCDVSTPSEGRCGTKTQVFAGNGAVGAGQARFSEGHVELKGSQKGGAVLPLALSLMALRALPRDLFFIGGKGKAVASGVLSVPRDLARVSRPSVHDFTAAARHPTPYSPSALLAELSDLPSGGQRGGVKILHHETPLPGGETRHSWSVVIRGTQNWGVGGSNPQDMLSNFQEVAGLESDQSRAVLQAMEMAGIHPGDPVEFVGHSQGGIVAARLASDPAVAARYSVVSALTAGAPIAASSPLAGVGVLALENTRDLVPSLDGASNAEGVVTVHFDGRGRAEGSPGVPAAHDLKTYTSLMADIESGSVKSASDLSFAPVRSWEAARTEKLGLNPQTRTSEFRYETRRILP